VHHYRVTWSKDGTWEKMCDRLGGLVRENEGHDEKPSAGVIDARSVRGAPTVTSPTRGYDAGKKISGRKTPGIVGTLGLLIGVIVLAASAVTISVGSRPLTVRSRNRNGSPRSSVTQGPRMRSRLTAAHTTSQQKY